MRTNRITSYDRLPIVTVDELRDAVLMSRVHPDEEPPSWIATDNGPAALLDGRRFYLAPDEIAAELLAVCPQLAVPAAYDWCERIFLRRA